jgi:hypothetical protein
LSRVVLINQDSIYTLSLTEEQIQLYFNLPCVEGLCTRLSVIFNCKFICSFSKIYCCSVHAACASHIFLSLNLHCKDPLPSSGVDLIAPFAFYFQLSLRFMHLPLMPSPTLPTSQHQQKVHSDTKHETEWPTNSTPNPHLKMAPRQQPDFKSQT